MLFGRARQAKIGPLPNRSPWLRQMRRARPIAKLTGEGSADVAIVGAGIAGVSTAYFLLRDTKKSVVILEANKVAHGATGHNAGQVVPYFERSFTDLVREFGLLMAADGQKAMDSTWELFEQIFNETQLQTRFDRFTGYLGVSTIDQLILHLHNNAWRLKAGLSAEKMYVSGKAADLKKIPDELRPLVSRIPHEDVLSLLETKDKAYIGVVCDPKGVLNSAAFCEELVNYMLRKYGGRFRLAELTPVKTVTLGKTAATIDLGKRQLKAKRVVLCTNGFTNIHIVNETGADIDTKFHHDITGTVGYMAAYCEPLNHGPIGISYITSKTANTDDPYFYITRRAFELEKKEQHNLICIGGPEHELARAEQYSPDDAVERKAVADIDAFVHKTYRHAPAKIDYRFHWHGLMGYTPNRIRLIGPEPCNPVLLYNLGCNGTGIMSSVYGGKRVSEIVAGKKLAPSIFDPRDQRCDLA